MTAKERAALQTLFNTVQDFESTQSAILHELMDLNEKHGDGHRWCSWKANLDGLAKTAPGTIYHRWQWLKNLDAQGFRKELEKCAT